MPFVPGTFALLKRAGPIRYGYIFRAKKYIRKALIELAAAASAKGW